MPYTSDPLLSAILSAEEAAQRTELSLIASESLQSPECAALGGCAFASRTAVGLPGHQRLGGCDAADALEMLACERACAAFGAEHANVLPVSASTATLSVMAGCLAPEDLVLALDPSLGSHSTHGASNHVSRRMCRSPSSASTVRRCSSTTMRWSAWPARCGQR